YDLIIIKPMLFYVFWAGNLCASIIGNMKKNCIICVWTIAYRCGFILVKTLHEFLHLSKQRKCFEQMEGVYLNHGYPNDILLDAAYALPSISFTIYIN
ncbi:hypothetical protein ACJX0J_028436, partial [Zea mays]